MANGKSPTDITPIGYHNYRGNSDQKFGVKMDDRRRHVYVVGKTGVGKSTLLENMAIADIEAGRGIGGSLVLLGDADEDYFFHEREGLNPSPGLSHRTGV